MRRHVLNMKSDPAGNAGDRIACGPITKEMQAFFFHH
jgi:hypothetical protein